MKIIDTFTFYNELEMLQYRLEILYPIIDYFVIVEATRTFSGKEKPLYYQENKSLFDKYQDKIIHIVDNDLVIPDITKGEQWENEYHQRNSIDIGIRKLDLKPQDLILISDVDEIPDIDRLNYIKENHFEITYSYLIQDMYYYNLNTKRNEVWDFSKIINYDFYLQYDSSPQKIRMGKPFQYINRAGWHLSYFGDISKIKNKIENFAHQEFNNAENIKEEMITSRIEKGVDLFGRGDLFIQIPIHENNYLPPRAEEYFGKYMKK